MRSFLGSPVPPSFHLRTVSIPPGGSIPYRAEEWEGAIVAVEQGELEAECVRGGRRRFGRGALLYLQGLPLRALHSTGGETLLLLAVARRGREPSGLPRAISNLPVWGLTAVTAVGLAIHEAAS